MSTGFVVSLALAVAAVIAARSLLPGLPMRGRAVTLTLTEVALTLFGLAILAFHCVAMFFTDAARRLPGSDGVIEDIRALGTLSFVWYLVPALVLLLGLRRLPPLAVAVVSVGLLGIGVTMYNGGSLETHLVAIFAGTMLLTATIATFVRPPGRSATPERLTPRQT